MTERLRGRAGQAARLRRLARTNGLCEWCLTVDRVEPATEVDHIRPLAKGGADVDSNTRNLCADHHREATAEQFGHRFVRGGRGVTRSGRPTGADHPWNQPKRP
ncbi:MAG: HNH endonuclease signature motif containing protein [Sphingobium sp.]|nr:HNH endonuclease signature motif containing protein [Sphingobium sp.]